MKIFFFTFICTRIAVFIELKKNNFLNFKLNDFANHNFFELFIFNHTIPNGHLLLEKIISVINLHTFTFYYLINIIYTCLFCFFLNDILKQIKINKTHRVIFLLISSTILLPYESWRINHHDHINLFIISYLFWSVFYFIQNGRNFNHLIFGLILLNFFYTLGFLYSFIFFIYLILMKKINYIDLDKFYFLKFFFLFLIISLIFFKNFLSSSIFSSTSMGGANLIQRTIHAIGENKFQNLIEIKKEKFPIWWVNINKEIIEKNKKENLLDNRISNLAFGLLEKNIFINFMEQQKIIKKTDKLEEEIKTLIEKDNENFKDKSWLYKYGYQQNLVSTKYQSYGINVFIEACKLYPLEMLIGNIGNKGIFFTSLQMISYSGLLPNYYESKNRYLNLFSNHFNNIMRIVIILILLLTPIVLVKNINYHNLKKVDIFYLLILLSISLIIFMTSTITCCENPRMLVMHFISIFLLSVMNLNYIFKFNYKKNV